MTDMLYNPPHDGWFCVFAAATVCPAPDQLPKKHPLSGSTVRQQFQAAASGAKIRLTFSNEYCSTLDPPGEDMVIESVRIARLLKPGEPNIDLSSDTAVTFGGAESVSIPSGGTVTSDAIDFRFESLEFLAVSVKFGPAPEYVTCHSEADCSSWVTEGNHVSENFNPQEWMWSYFSFCRADGVDGNTYCCADAADGNADCCPQGLSKSTETLVCFGDSITDGAVSTFNGFDAWPNLLAQALARDPATAHISAVNTAIAGNAIWGGWGVAAKERFKRDILGVPGARMAIILIGTNDIPGAQTDTSEAMISEYKAMISACHARGIKVWGGTITPFGNNDWWASELHERIRARVNEWIMSNDSGFNGYIDFAAATCDPANKTVLKAEYDSGDGLHPSAKGHRAMGEAAVEVIKGIVK